VPSVASMIPTVAAGRAPRIVRWLGVLAVALVARGVCAAEQGLSKRKLELLNSLGYVDYAGQGDSEGDGLVVRDAARAAPGWNLLTYHVLARAELVDEDGHVVHVWTSESTASGDERWARTFALPGGDLLVITRPPGLHRIRRDGNLVWTSDLPVHHYADVLPDGKIVALTSSTRRSDRFAEEKVMDNGIAILSSSGAVIEKKSLLDILARRPDVFELGPPDAPPRPQRRALDVLHANRVDWLAAAVPGHPAFGRGTVLVTVRHQDSVVLIDWAKGEPVWAWGRGILGRPHDGSVLPNGHVLVFDNIGMGHGSSRIVEVDPVNDAVVWTWSPPKPGGCLSRTRGTAQRLAGGNTLIGESNRGRAFEVTRAGEVVWDYRTPHRDADGHRAAFRIDRYPRDLFPWVRSDD